MQVFLPYPDFAETAKVLDDKRLGNQCYRECVTLYRGGWPNHPASKIWANHKRALAKYSLALVLEMEKRKKWKPEVIFRWTKFWEDAIMRESDTGMPSVVGNLMFHASHRAALLAKNPDWYSRFGWKETPKIDYIWK